MSLGSASECEALAAVTTGAIPEALDTFVMSLPQGEQFSARMLARGRNGIPAQPPYDGRNRRGLGNVG